MFATLARIAFLCRKELLALLKEPASRAILIAPALVQSLLFGYAATYDVTHAPYAVLDQSRGAAASNVLARVDGTGIFQRIGHLENANQIAAAIERDNALLVLVFPADFERRLAAGAASPRAPPRRCSSCWTAATRRRPASPRRTSAPSSRTSTGRVAPPCRSTSNGASGTTPTSIRAGASCRA